MIADISKADNIYIVCGVTDMRKSKDGLNAIVQDKFQMDPRQSTMSLFGGRIRDRFKELLWKNDDCFNI